MQRLAIVSDTHWELWDPEDPFAESLIQQLSGKDYDAIWHGGDVVHESVLVALEEIAPVVCVKGNCDTFFARQLPHAVHRQVEGVSLGMIHGWDLALQHAPSLLERFPEKIEVIIHGHTHRRRYQQEMTPWGSCTIINPGSVTSPRGGEEPGFGELVINGPAWSYRRHTLRL
jgi:putative phosphoesterase